MGEAEDAFRRRQQARNSEENAKYAALLPTIQALIPRAVANLKKHGFPDVHSATWLDHEGEERIGWELTNEAGTEYTYIYLLADGTLAKGESHTTSVYTLPPSANTDAFLTYQVQEMKRVLENLAISDFK